MYLHVVCCVAHGYADGSVAQHAYVIASVAERHRLFQADAEVADDFVYAFLFGVSFGGDVGKGGEPASGFATGQLRQDFLFLFLGDERRHLEYLLSGGFLGRLFGDDVHFQKLVEYLLYHVGRPADTDVMLADEDAGEVLAGGDLCQFLHVGGGYGAFVNHGLACEAISAVHGDVTVYQSAVLQGGEVVDDDCRPSRGNKYPYAFCLGGRDGFDGGFRNAMGGKAN